MRALVTGATGLLGKELVARLGGAVVLSRDADRAGRQLGPSVEARPWSPEEGPVPAERFRGVDAVVNLAGESVAGGRWTPERKRAIRDSRVLGTRNLMAGLAGAADRPKVLVSASAVGYYGNRGDEVLEETSAAGSDFLASVCAEWEREATRATELGMRVVCVRIGIVLAPRGGALARMLPPFRLGAGGRLGSGRQWMPWVHIDDVIGIVLHGLRDEGIAGPVNAVSPAPARNAEFTRALGRALHRPALLPVPEVALRVAFGELSDVLLASQRVLPRVAERAGYTFRYPELPEALAAALAPASPRAAA